MAKRALTVETACPFCGHSPIAADDQRCPKCYRAFKAAGGLLRHNDREVAPVDAEFGTRIGGLDLLTSDAEAHPGAMAAALLLLGVYAGAAGMGVFPVPGERLGYLALSLANLALAAALFGVPSLVRPLVIVSSPLQVATWAYLARAAPSFPTVAVALLPIGILAGVTGATGPRRRSLVLLGVLGITGFSATVLAKGGRPPGPHVSAPGADFSFALPPGFRVLRQPEQLQGYLPLAGTDPRLKSFAFADPERGVGGFWSLSTPHQVAPAKLAESMAALLDGENAQSRLVHAELHALADCSQVSWEVPLPDGRVASATAVHLPDERTALLVVAAQPTDLEPVRQALASGASFVGAVAADRR